MNTQLKVVVLWFSLAGLVLGAGRPSHGVLGTHGCSSSTTTWAEATEELQIDAANLTELRVKTHNGLITHAGESGGTSAVVVVAMKKGGGSTEADAEEALAAIQIVSESADNGTHRLGWKWSTNKEKSWKAQVSFEISAPAGLAFTGETHNGRIEVTGVTADVKAVTHNGRVSAECSGGTLHAETHNGRVSAKYEGSDVTLVTHNGSVDADLRRCGSINGDVETHNGSVEIILGQAASAKLRCNTHNGRIKVDQAIREQEYSRRKLTGVLGTGDGNLDVTTHNGSIRIKEAG